MDRRLGCKHRHHPLPYGRQDDDHLSEKGRGRICNTGRNSRANDSSTFGLPHRPTRHHRAPQPRNPSPQARELPAETHSNSHIHTTATDFIRFIHFVRFIHARTCLSGISGTHFKPIRSGQSIPCGCELLSNLYLCGCTNNAENGSKTAAHVVNCFQICIFADTQTTLSWLMLHLH